MKKYLLILAALCLTGCAAGAATAGYALHSKTSDSLSSEAEMKLINRIKQEVANESIRTDR